MQNLVLIGAADSIGVPYTRDNCEHKGFFEMIAEYLSQKYAVTTINCFHMSINNDNRYIYNLISGKHSLADIKKSQNQMLKKCKYSGIYPYFELPKSFLNHYQINPKDKHIIVKNYIRKHDTIFIYSAFTNDLLKSQKLSLFKLLKPGEISRKLKSIDTTTIINNLENNISNLIQLNPNIQIYIVGLFIPTKISYIRKNLSDFISSTNDAFRQISIKYDNVFLIDNSNLSSQNFNNIDFHPNKNGHMKIYQNFLKVFEKS